MAINKDILLIEDDVDDAEFTQRALRGGSRASKIHWVKDGQEALDFLFQEGCYVHTKQPGLILLDIDIPKVSGIEILKIVKRDEKLRVIPVIMLTHSDSDQTGLLCYKMGANSYIAKPAMSYDFFRKIRSFKRYWLLTDRGFEMNH